VSCRRRYAPLSALERPMVERLPITVTFDDGNERHALKPVEIGLVGEGGVPDGVTITVTRD
jgi:hypothetical protein